MNPPNKDLNTYGLSTFVFKKNGIMSKILETVEIYASLQNPILLTGETGTGKEYIVKIIHALSKRPGKLIRVNLSAIPKELIENELFGHIKGAFTGADTTTEGFIEKASNGSLFLDEIGEIPLEHQVKILRVVQENEFEKLGSNKTIQSSARFIFATSKNLEEEVNKKNFRADLFYRISTFHIHLPPLRERKEDIPLLIDHFLWITNQKYNKKIKIQEEAYNKLLEYNWPGNIRELENTIHRLVIGLPENKKEITIQDLPEKIIYNNNIDLKIQELEIKKREVLQLEKEVFKEVVQFYKGNLYKAAKKLKISRGSIQYKLKKYNLK
ncbi:MAG: sigma 54-interacting transcriptional regulator [Leptonema sp. (in: bacteria)]